MSRARAALLTVLSGLLVAAGTPAATAFDNSPGTGGPPQSQPSQTSSSGSSGSAASETRGNCSIYANSSSFGLSCVAGGSAGGGEKVKDVLGPSGPPTCWDEAIPNADLQGKYGYDPVPGMTYYTWTCITGLDLNRTLYDQPGVRVTDRSVIELPDGAPPCRKPYRPAEDKNTCLITLDTPQQTVAGALTQLKDGMIPDPMITTHPSTRVRTNEAVAYTDSSATRTPHYSVGGVTMWASVDSDRLTIRPYGPDDPAVVNCPADVRVAASDTPASVPAACWWTYPRSSAAQPGQAYPLRAELRWTVYVNGAPFAHFVKYQDVQLPVFDIQTVVVGG